MVRFDFAVYVPGNNDSITVSESNAALNSSYVSMRLGDYYSNDTARAEAEQNGRDEYLAKIEVGIMGIMFLVTLVGNCILLTVITCQKGKMNRMHYFIVHLSIADLITAFCSDIPQLIWKITWNFRGGNGLCKFLKFIQIFGPYSSSYILAATAIDRYQVICKPLRNFRWSRAKSNRMLLFAWTLSLLLCTPQIFIFSYMDNDLGIPDCWATFVPGWEQKSYVIWYTLTVFVIPLGILWTTYTKICLALWCHYSSKNFIRRHAFQDDAVIQVQSALQVQERKRDCMESQLAETVVVVVSQVSRGQEQEEKIEKRGSSEEDLGENSGCALDSEREDHLRNNMELINVLDSEFETHSQTDGKESYDTLRSENIRRWAGKLERNENVDGVGGSESGRGSLNSVIKGRCLAKGDGSGSRGGSGGKIKSIKLTVTIIFFYVVCSIPFIAVQIWAAFYPGARESVYWKGPIITILTLLASLNSCVNPWIFLFFNYKLFGNVSRAFACFSRWR